MKFNLAKKWLKKTNMLHLQMYFFKNQKIHEKSIRPGKKMSWFWSSGGSILTQIKKMRAAK